MVKVVEFPNGKCGVNRGNYYHAAYTNRWYDAIVDIMTYCMMEKDRAETICILLKGRT